MVGCVLGPTMMSRTPPRCRPCRRQDSMQRLKRSNFLEQYVEKEEEDEKKRREYFHCWLDNASVVESVVEDRQDGAGWVLVLSSSSPSAIVVVAYV